MKLKPGIFILLLLISISGIFNVNAQNSSEIGKIFKAGAATSNITPRIGTSINGSMKDITIKQIHDETHARAIVLDDGQTRLAIVVADLCMVSREVLDDAKQRANKITGIPVQNMMISATHTHSGGTACSVFQSDPDKDYLIFLRERIADAVIRANNNLVPARIGWAVGNEPSQVFNRRWK
jgi:predicted neutral ceramidase superfamily lipid hydrolase